MKWKLIGFVTVLLAAWSLNHPVPENFSQPYVYRLTITINNIITNLGWSLEYLGLSTYREAMIWAFKDSRTADIPPGVQASNETLAGVNVRVYRPKNAPVNSAGHPALVYYHGGGFYMLSAYTYMFDSFMLNIMADIEDIVIVSVEYRLAPQFKFPVPLEDCVAVTKYVLKNTAAFKVDPRRVAIGGDSAGGNLAATVALKLRDDEFEPMPKSQLLIYPMLQAVDLSLPSFQQNAKGFLAQQWGIAAAYSLYAAGSIKYAHVFMNSEHVSREDKQHVAENFIRHGDLAEEFRYAPYSEKPPVADVGDAAIWQELKAVTNPYFSPLLAEDLSELPEAFILTAHYDVLRDDGLLYAKRLRDAGVKVLHSHGPSNVHASCTLVDMIPIEGMECVRSVVSYLKTL